MLEVIRFEFLKFYKKPAVWIFCLLFPIIWTIYVNYVGHSNIVNKFANLVFPAITIYIILSLTIPNFANLFMNDRLNKRIKQYKIANLSQIQYLTALFLFEYLIFFCVFIITFIISIAWFKLTISVNLILTMLIGPVIFFVIHFLLGIIIANNVKDSITGTIVIMISFFVLLFTSGVLVNSQSFGSWFKYLQMLTPTGSGVLILTHLANNNDISKIWYVYLIALAYLILFVLLSIKTFKWE